MKKTTTLFELVKSELIASGKNEFFNDGHLSFFNDEFSFIKKMLSFDDDVYTIVNKKFFQNLELDKTFDREFKRMFLERFLNAQIRDQTIEAFSAQVLTVTLENARYIHALFINFEDFLTGSTNSDSKNDSKNTSDNRALDSDLPQNNINLNVDDTVLDYGTRNNISRGKLVTESTGNTKNKNYNVETLFKMQAVFSDLLDIYDKKCFLHVW